MSVRQQAGRLRLHDDTEEDLVGTDWQQRAIVETYTSLSDLAEDEQLPWHVGNQLALVVRMPDGTRWRPNPDIMVHATAGPAPREEMDAGREGVPALVVEVLSRTTWRYDVDDVEGKAGGYMAAGVPEYLVFDPTGNFLKTPCRGWRQEDGVVVAGLPEADGRYRSRVLGISLLPDGMFPRVVDRHGRVAPLRSERRRERELQAREQALQSETIAAQAREIAIMRDELARLRDRGPIE